ncbi:MAG: hypothetical protein SF162_20335 [bacterium]|nr:hypothetical protein [bacterium]
MAVRVREVVERLQAGLNAMGYQPYDPFGLIPGRAYPKAVKLFVCDGRDGWISVKAAPEPETMMAAVGLAKTVLAFDPFPFVLALALHDSDALPNNASGALSLVETYAGDEKIDPAAALGAHLKPGRTADDLRAALGQPVDPAGRTAPAVRIDSLAAELLPADVRSKAKGVSAAQSQPLIERLTHNLLGKVGGAVPPGTGDLLRGNAPAWSSPAGQRITAFMEYIAIPGDWRDPDFVAVRDAYALAVRRQRHPALTLLPGDQAALDAVPNPLRYTPIYMGKA